MPRGTGVRGVALMLVLCASAAGCPTTNTGGYEPVGRRDAGPPVLACEEACLTNADCLAGFVCGSFNRCEPERPPQACERDIQCHARQSGWRETCLMDASCPANQACVGGANDPGWCARKPTSDIPCTMTGQETLTLARKDGSGTVSVCGVTTQQCLEGLCRVACRSNGDCGGEYPFCNTTTGLCECSVNSCRTNSSTCVSGRCECVTDDDCTVASDICRNGACNCSSVAACTPTARVHPGTRWVCE